MLQLGFAGDQIEGIVAVIVLAEEKLSAPEPFPGAKISENLERFKRKS
jgi:hypothetical protein